MFQYADMKTNGTTEEYDQFPDDLRLFKINEFKTDKNSSSFRYSV
jgi:hypothetical protein